MPQTVTTLFQFPSSALGFVPVVEPGVTAAWTGSVGNPAGCLSMRAVGDLVVTNNRWALTPITWETLGVPPGATVSRAWATYQWRCLEYGGEVSTAGQVMLYTADLSSLIAPISYSGGSITGLTPTWQDVPPSGGSLWTIDPAYGASNQPMQLHVRNSLLTYFGESEVAVQLVIDNLEINVEHSTVLVEGGTVNSTSAVNGSFSVVEAAEILTFTGSVASMSAVSGQGTVIRVGTGTVASSSAVSGAFVVVAEASGAVTSVSTVTGNAILVEGGTIFTFTGLITAASVITGEFLAPKIYVEAGTIASVSVVAGGAEVITGESFTVASVSTVVGVWEVDAGFDGAIESASTVTGDAGVIEEAGLYIESGAVESVSLVELVEEHILAFTGEVNSFSRVTGEFTAENSEWVYQEGDFRMGVMRHDRVSTMVN